MDHHSKSNNQEVIYRKPSKHKLQPKYDAAYEENLNKNKGWMLNIDRMDGKPDGWLKCDILYDQFPGLTKQISGVTTKYEDGSIFFNSDEMAAYITKTYNKK